MLKLKKTLFQTFIFVTRSGLRQLFIETEKLLETIRSDVFSRRLFHEKPVSRVPSYNAREKAQHPHTSKDSRSEMRNPANRKTPQ